MREWGDVCKHAYALLHRIIRNVLLKLVQAPENAHHYIVELTIHAAYIHIQE